MTLTDNGDFTLWHEPDIDGLESELKRYAWPGEYIDHVVTYSKALAELNTQISQRVADEARVNDEGDLEIVFTYRKDWLGGYTSTHTAMSLALEHWVSENISPGIINLEADYNELQPLGHLPEVILTICPGNVTPEKLYDLLDTLLAISSHDGGLGDWQEAEDILDGLQWHSELLRLELMTGRHDMPEITGTTTVQDIQKELYGMFFVAVIDEAGWSHWPERRVREAIKLINKRSEG